MMKLMNTLKNKNNQNLQNTLNIRKRHHNIKKNKELYNKNKMMFKTQKLLNILNRKIIKNHIYILDLKNKLNGKSMIF